MRELLFEGAPHAIAIVGPDGRIAEANDAFATLLQRQPAELAGLRLPDLLDCPLGDHPVATTFMCRLLRADGSWAAAEVAQTPLPHDYRLLVLEDRSALEASEERYRNALHAAGLTAWEMHQGSERLVVSDSFRTLFDLPPTTPLPTTIAELRAMLHPEDRERVRLGRLSVQSGSAGARTPFEIVYRIVTPAGEVRWMRTRGELVRAGPDDPGIIYAITRNISHLVETERRLRESEEQFRLAFDESAVGMALISNAGVTLRVNAALAGMFGYSMEDAVNVQWHQLLHPDELADAAAILREITSGNLPSSRAERRCRHHDGHIVWTQMTVAGVRGQASRPEELIVQVEDITERKLAEAALREAEERLATVLEATRDGVWDWDCVTGTIYYGPQWFGILGYPAEGRYGDESVFTQLVHPDDRDRTWAENQKQLREPIDSYDMTFRMRHADGNWVWVRSRGRAVARDAQGRALRIVGTHTDVTRERSLEEQIRHAQKMDAVGKLAGGIAHDFNNLLTAIGATTELLLGTTSPDDPHHQDLEHIALAATRARTLTRQLLAFSRQDIEQMAEVEVDAVVAKVAPLLQRVLGPGQRLALELDAPGQSLRLDPANLELALLNLVANARDAMPYGGTVTVASARAEMAPLAEGTAPVPAVSIVVRDTGVGMPPEVRERLFEPFFTTKPQGKGTGLGMPTVYGFARRLDGTVTVESTLGEGTTVQLLLPVSQGTPAVDSGVAKPAAHSPRHAVRRVLVVDDESVVRRSTTRLLEHQGIEVVAVDGAEAALAELATSAASFDVVLSDHAMPGRTGHQLLEEIGVRYPDQRVVLMSGFADDDNLRRTFGNRDVPFLAKPFTLDELLRALDA
jgi:PAS domain S-box-containing protein